MERTSEAPTPITGYGKKTVASPCAPEQQVGGFDVDDDHVVAGAARTIHRQHLPQTWLQLVECLHHHPLATACSSLPSPASALDPTAPIRPLEAIAARMCTAKWKRRFPARGLPGRDGGSEGECLVDLASHPDHRPGHAG